MRFFLVVFVTLGVIWTFNLMDAAMSFLLLPKVYQCSEVTKQDPINVQKKCKK
jgi:hypothetical protein